MPATFDIAHWRAVLDQLGFTPREAKRGTAAYAVAMREYRTSTGGAGVGSSKPATVAPARKVVKAVDVSDEIARLTAEIMERRTKLLGLHETRKRDGLVRVSRGKSEKSKSAHSSKVKQVSDRVSKMSVQEVDEDEFGGALTPAERALAAIQARARQAARRADDKRARNGQPKLGYSRSGKKLTAYQAFCQLHSQGVRPEDFGAHVKKIAALWRQHKAAAGA